MVNEQNVYMHTTEIVEHANGTAQYLDALLGGRFVSKEQTHDMVAFLFARTKMNIESCFLLHKKKRMKRYYRGRVC